MVCLHRAAKPSGAWLLLVPEGLVYEQVPMSRQISNLLRVLRHLKPLE
jgi:hypothetical protein